ncbi:MAG TPA: transcription antitermination factor NusB [Actinomycetota bacterium]|nr:transcription antitermination factor NusB [Actinomycetota bacterium]
MKGRRAARRLAVDALYEAEIRGQLPVDTFDAQQLGARVLPTSEDVPEEPNPAEITSQDSIDYARTLVTGIQEHLSDIDFLISRYADRWAIDRMPVIDRTLVRIAVFELLWGTEVPTAVVINEAVEMAKSMSTEDSGRFVNGVLGKIAESEVRRP